MFSKKSSTSKPKFLNLHTLAPITVAVLAVYSSAASADYVLKDGVSLTGTDPTVDIYHTDKNLTLTNSSGAALDNLNWDTGIRSHPENFLRCLLREGIFFFDAYVFLWYDIGV